VNAGPTGQGQPRVTARREGRVGYETDAALKRGEEAGKPASHTSSRIPILGLFLSGDNGMANDATGLDYATVLVDLQDRRDALAAAVEGLDAAIAALTRVITGSIGGAATSAPPSTASRKSSIKADSFYRMTVTDAAKKYLAMVGEPRPVADIADALNKGGLPCKVDSVMSLISRAARATPHEFEKIGGGQWGLPEWYEERKEPGGDAA